MLGFAMRAGKVVIGTDLVCRAMARRDKGKPKIVLISLAASEGTKKKVLTKSEFYGIPAEIIDISKEELGRLLGKLFAPSAVAVTDTGFAKEIEKALSPAHETQDAT